MPNSDVVASELIAAREGALEAPASANVNDVVPGLGRGGGGVISDVVARKLSRPLTLPVTDSQLALLVSAALFVLAAWPLALTEVPPYQDLPNHLAAITVIEHPEQYPEFVFNGFFKTNAALFAWLYLVGKAVGVSTAARLFALLVLGMNAMIIPRFVLALTGSRRRMVIASLFAWPMIHNWFVSMGMLDFALGVPLSLALLVMLDKHRKEPPSLPRAAAITTLAFLTWYAHVFPLLVVHMLVAIHALLLPGGWRARWNEARRLFVPLLPVTALAIVSTYEHLRESVGPMTAYIHQTKLLAAWELIYNLWAAWFWGFTKLSMTSLVPCVLLGVYGAVSFFRKEKAPPFFSGVALAVLALLYIFAPYKVTNWYHVNSRLIPFIFFALLLRVPDRLPKKLAFALGLSAVLYSAAMGVDFVRLDRDRRDFIAGIDAVPQNARLLPLLFNHKGTSDNTRSLLHAWGFYVEAKHTSAPLLFAHSRSFPVMYSTPPPMRFNHLVLEPFAPDMASPEGICRAIGVVVNDCNAEYRARWGEFWHDATPMFDHVLLWDATPEALAEVPPDYRVVFRQDKLVIMQRADTTATR
jgi:hypothetical protein